MTINQYLITKGTETIPPILTSDEQMKMRKTIRLLGIEAFDRYTKKSYTPEDIDALMEMGVGDEVLSNERRDAN